MHCLLSVGFFLMESMQQKLQLPDVQRVDAAFVQRPSPQPPSRGRGGKNGSLKPQLNAISTWDLGPSYADLDNLAGNRYNAIRPSTLPGREARLAFPRDNFTVSTRPPISHHVVTPSSPSRCQCDTWL